MAATLFWTSIFGRGILVLESKSKSNMSLTDPIAKNKVDLKNSFLLKEGVENHNPKFLNL